ncbi:MULTISPECIES: S8 family peptidase [unclassified Bradyrhizobium]|uniref:S8 family peptidase n=1 Tax=unclassified Bradyrhizobium TaxID=2631580 RepID=UPI0029162828|nr:MULTISPECIES: S8 family peptidase [unclassified Bradyrhizobium]
MPARDRAAHAQTLTEQLDAIKPQAAARAEEQRAIGIDAGLGIYLRFDSEPNFPLKFESLDITGSGIQLCSVKTLQDNTMQATVFVPENKLELFLRKIEAYRDENTQPRTEHGIARPKNQDFVESISNIQLAALEALWTEETLPFPLPDAAITWELWLRREARIDHLARLRGYAEHFNLTVGEQVLNFVDRTVVLVRGTAIDLARSVEILGMIAELRLPKVTATFFTEMTSVEQRQWIDDLTAPAAGAPYVCLLDTGVNRAHALLAPLIDETDLHTYKPAWNVDDRYGHGTEMAGLASFGDLTDVLAAQGPVVCTHRIESVKIFNEDDPHEPELYGAVTEESAARVEVTADRNRVFCMSVTSTDGRDRGRPSSWSAAVDALAAGLDGAPKRLFLVSAGNTAADQRRNYPASNLTDGIHDPAQSWNALTVGGYTDKVTIDGNKWPQWQPLAPRGDLAACSCTSTTWTRWPFKPDIVMEAGNLASNPDVADPADLDDLQLLTTAHNFAGRPPLITFGDTSAAAALASRFAAMLWAKYPHMRPETVRALMAHFAEWTPAMLARFSHENGRVDYKTLLRCCGYGVPNLPRLLSSLDNCLTLVAETELEPFFKEGGTVKTREMRPHPLPWPIDELAELGDTEVMMRVTLSYFVEPSPGGRGWAPRYGYQSHGLRFAVRNPLETIADFERRINKFARDEEYRAPGLADPGWQFGRLSGLTSVGSLHSDVWRGTAASLAARGHLAVYPTMGWWNKRPHLNAWNRTARYSLIVTIETPGIETDIYTPVANQIGVPIEIEV